MKRLFYVLCITVVALFGLTFAYKNHQIVDISYYFGWQFSTSLPALLLCTIALGVVFGYVLGVVHAKVRARVAQHKAQRAKKRESEFPVFRQSSRAMTEVR